MMADSRGDILVQAENIHKKEKIEMGKDKESRTLG